MKMVRFVRSLQRMMLLWGNFAIVHCQHSMWRVMFTKNILLPFDRLMVIPSLYGLREPSLIHLLIRIIPIVFSFSTFVPRHRKECSRVLYWLGLYQRIALEGG